MQRLQIPSQQTVDICYPTISLDFSICFKQSEYYVQYEQNKVTLLLSVF